jgi:Ca2+/Na+ antiporter
MDKRLKDIYVIIGRIGTQSSVSLNLLQLSNEKSVNQQHLDNLEQIRFDAIAITITVFSLLITVVYNMLNISVQSLIKSILMILLFTIFILFLLVVIYYTVKINNENKNIKNKEQTIEKSRNIIINTYKNYISNLERWEKET